jgi:DNA-binding transcriptional regulator YdaS (Cro superfamily)
MNLYQYLKADATAPKRIASYVHTTEDAIWEISQGYRRPDERTCWRIEGATHGAVRVHDLRPDLGSIKESCCISEQNPLGSI